MIDLTQGVTPERKQTFTDSSKDSNVILSPLRPHKFERMCTPSSDLTLLKPVTHRPTVGLGGCEETIVETEWHAYRRKLQNPPSIFISKHLGIAHNPSSAEKVFGKQTYSKGPTDAIVKVTFFPNSYYSVGSKRE
jgi:hypothetical protein